MSLPEMSVSSGAKKRIQTFHDGSKRDIAILQTEFPYPEGKLLISCTDLHGNITRVNRAFIAVSGYTEAELIGQPHHIVRHPDMPRMVFKDLWEAIKQGQKWHGLVKNLRKDGQYYQAYLTVVACHRDNQIKGFIALSRQVSTEKIFKFSKLYQKNTRQRARINHVQTNFCCFT